MVKKSHPSPKKSINTSQELYDNFSKVIKQFMGGKRYEPMGQAALFKRLSIPSKFHPLCKEIIADLIKQEIIEVQKKQLILKVEKPDVVTGTLRLHPRGFGFVQPDHPAQCPQDIFIPKHLTDSAVDGDRVEVVLATEQNMDKGPEGRIVTVLKRSRSHIAGTIQQFDSKGNMMAYVPILGSSRPVFIEKSDDFSLKVGDRVIIQVKTWGTQDAITTGEVTHLIGHISNPSCDVQAAIEEYDIQDLFSKPTLKEAKSFGTRVLAKELKKRENLSKITTFTIDPETARDFDDALSLTKNRKKQYQLGVHIADVAHYVPPNSHLDMEAQIRCNSTYFPGTCVPMLPEELSNHLCSLRPNVIRLTVSVLMTFDEEGTLLEHQIVRSYIKSRKRFTYQEAFDIIEGRKKSIHSKALKLMVELCHLLKKKRYERGSIDFSLPDNMIEVDEKGMPLGMKTIEYDISHQLVEEFMLKANEVVAKHLSDRGSPVLYRIHEEPSAENFDDFLSLARSLGFEVPVEPTTQDLQKLFEKAKGTPFAQQLSIGFIRSMKLAFYSPENVGHYGLALEHYCHFTSPIRRYTDLVTQRVLFGEEGKDVDFKLVAQKCSDQERVSFRAESSVKLLKKMRLLKSIHQKDPKKKYPAIVTKVKPFGIYFEVTELSMEGFLHISHLENDYFYFDERNNVLIGERTRKVHKIAEKISVSVFEIDFILLETKWMLSR